MYGFHSQVRVIINSFTSCKLLMKRTSEERASEFYDTKEQVNKNCIKHMVSTEHLRT